MPRSPEQLIAPKERVPLPARAMYLQGRSGAPFFAVLHSAALPTKQTAVLLCPPFGWEDMCSYRSRREWAEHLALAGHMTLRIDFPGAATALVPRPILGSWRIGRGPWTQRHRGCGAPQAPSESR